MSIQLLTTCQPDAMRDAAQAAIGWVDSMAEEFTPLNLRALALVNSDWDGDASIEFKEAWVQFRHACGLLVEVMRDAAAIVTRLADAIAPAKRQFQTAIDEARAAGLQVDLTTGEVTPPPIVLRPEPAFPLGAGEVAVADQVRRANLDIQDAIRTATEADRRAEEELAALQPQIDLLQVILKNLGVAMEGYGGFAGTLNAVAGGLKGTPSAMAQQWRGLANHPAFGPANLSAVKNVPGMGNIPRLGVLGVPVTYMGNVASGDSPARAGTRAVASGAVSMLGGAVGAGATAAVAGALGVAMVTPVGAVVVGVGFAVSYGLSMYGAEAGDNLGRELHDRVIAPITDKIQGTVKDWF